MRILLLVLVFTPTALIAQGDGMAAACKVTEPVEAIEEVRRLYIESFNAGRIDDVVDLHAEEVINMPAGLPPTQGREALRELISRSLESAPAGFQFEFRATELRIADGWAVERGVTKAYLEEDSGAIPGGKYVLLYEQGEAGCWRIAWSITNSNAPPG